jgi:hypothetical protein
MYNNGEPVFCIIAGDPIDGIMVYGPFFDSDDATEWAEKFVSSVQHWWVTELYSDITMRTYQ